MGSLAPMRKLLFTLLALIVVLVAADRIAVAVAEDKISDRLASAYGLPARPWCGYRGFPVPDPGAVRVLSHGQR